MKIAYYNEYQALCDEYGLDDKESRVAKTCFEWLEDNGSRVCNGLQDYSEQTQRATLHRELKAHVKRVYGIGPIASFFLYFVLNKLISWILDRWFLNLYVSGAVESGE